MLDGFKLNFGVEKQAERAAVETVADLAKAEEQERPAVENVIILGSGPAGWSAAIYTARANLRPLVITGN